MEIFDKFNEFILSVVDFVNNIVKFFQQLVAGARSIGDDN